MISASQHLANMAIASGICTAMIGYGTFTQRPNGSRRWVYTVAGLVATLMTGYVITVSQQSNRRDTTGLLMLGVGCLIIGRIAWAIGLRGQRVGDHPHCRGCGFDLFGKPEESTKCSECGNDLQLAGATVIGRRQPKQLLVMAGLFLLLFGAMATASAEFAAMKGQPVWHYAPTWLLVHELDSPSQERFVASELEMRLLTGMLTADQANTVANWALADQSMTDGVNINLRNALGSWMTMQSTPVPASVKKAFDTNIHFYSGPPPSSSVFAPPPLPSSDGAPTQPD